MIKRHLLIISVYVKLIFFKENYMTLLREVRSAFNEYGWLVTVAASADPNGYAYSIPEMNK